METAESQHFSSGKASGSVRSTTLVHAKEKNGFDTRNEKQKNPSHHYHHINLHHFFVFPRQNCTAGPRPVVSQLKVSALGFEPSLLRPCTALMFGQFLKVWRTGEKLIQLLQLIPWCQYAPWRGWPLLMGRNVRYWRALQGPLLEVFFGFEPHSHSRLFRMRKSPCFCGDPLIIQLNPSYLRTFLTRQCYVTTLQKPGKPLLPLLKITAVITLPSPSDWWHWWHWWHWWLLQKPHWHVTRVTWCNQCNLDMSWW